MSKKLSLLSILFIVCLFLFNIAFAKGISLSNFHPYVQEKINKNYYYPAQAAENNLNGLVRLELTIDRKGNLENIEVIEFSEHTVLNITAVKIARDCAPFSFPSDFPKPNIITDITIEFSAKSKASDELDSYEVKPDSKLSESVGAGPAQPFKEEVRREPLLSTSNGFKTEGVELSDFVDLALENNQPLQVAKKEMELAQIKIKEAYRNLFPSLKLQAYNTTGDVYNVDYEEREYKAVVEHPLFYGGRLKHAHKQAKVNLEITKRNYDNEKLETIHKTEVAYHTVKTLKMNLNKQLETLAEAKKILDITSSQYEKGVIIPLEFNTVKSWYQRLQLMRDSIEQELEMAKLTFKQVVNLDALPEFNDVDSDLPSQNKVLAYVEPLALRACIDDALVSRPEINLAKLTVQFYEYGHKMEKAKNNFNVNLMGGYGYYEGHYKTEPWKDSRNWYVGLKVTKPFGPNTASASYMREEAQPRYGQTSATGSQTFSGEIGILDNYARITDEKSSEIELLKAENQLEETMKNITFEVQDAYFKYQKSFLEVKSALVQVDFRAEGLKVSRVKVSHGEGEFPQLIEKLVELSEAQNTYFRALGNYYISLANLRKVTGYSGNL